MRRAVRSAALLAVLAALAACGGERSTITKTGSLRAGSIAVTAMRGKIEAYPPAAGEPKDRYTLAVYPRGAGAPVLNDVSSSSAHAFTASGGAADVLVRVPQGVRAVLRTVNGDIHVSDVNAPVDAAAQDGSIKIQIPSYADARTQHGNISATIGDIHWPGTLHFSSDAGDVEVWIPAVANAEVDLHTDHGTIFTDFNLRGSASGQAETITGAIGTGGARRVVVRAKNGNVRLLKLVPQM